MALETAPDAWLDESELVLSLKDALRDLGSPPGYFILRRRCDGWTSHHLALACDPLWGLEYEARGCSCHDPWLGYAEHRTAPIHSTAFESYTAEESSVALLASLFGFERAMLFPAPAPQTEMSVGLLVVADPELNLARHGRLKAQARDAAMGLHEQWSAFLRRQLFDSARLSPRELEILGLEFAGLGTKEIARRLGITCAAVDSQFQRLNKKLCVASRRAAAIRAHAYGIVSPHVQWKFEGNPRQDRRFDGGHAITLNP